MTEALGCPAPAAPRSVSILTCLCAVVAAVGVAGSLYLSIGMGLKACPLCFYQRAFAMASLAILVVGPFPRGTLAAPARALLALVPAAAGLGVAAFHVSLELRDVLECPKSIAEILTAPKQSLAFFVVLVTALCGAASRRSRFGAGRLLLAFVLGCLLSWGSIASAPPLPAAPTSAYPSDKPFDMCRPPYVTPS